MARPKGVPLGRPVYSLATISLALKKTGGVIQAAADMLGCSRQNVCDWISRYPELQRQQEATEQTLLDLAYANVVNEMRGTDPGRRFAASKFYLTQKGAALGFGNKVQISGTIKLGLDDEIDFDAIDPDLLEAYTEVLRLSMQERERRDASAPADEGLLAGKSLQVPDEGFPDSGPGPVRRRQAPKSDLRPAAGNKQRREKSGAV